MSESESAELDSLSEPSFFSSSPPRSGAADALEAPSGAAVAVAEVAVVAAAASPDLLVPLVDLPDEDAAAGARTVGLWHG